ncbi:MAG: hypothetical protein JWM90_652, partial [Thermoleophilia bacterium]|nr:hypothetical protein [Thermoleophilia bacterium]
LGIVSIALQPVLDPRPDVTCVADNEPSSGFRDGDKDCNISQASSEEINDWDSAPKPFRIIGVALILAGIVTAVVAFVRSRRSDGPPAGPAG